MSDYIRTTTYMKVLPAKKQLYSFNWKQGGYNQVYATSMDEALKEIDRQFKGSGYSSKDAINLKVEPNEVAYYRSTWTD